MQFSYDKENDNTIWCFDFAVQSEYGVEEICQTQIFGTDEDLVQTADALTQRIQELRTNGATYIHNGEHHTIGNDVEIAVFFYDPPRRPQ